MEEGKEGRMEDIQNTRNEKKVLMGQTVVLAVT